MDATYIITWWLFLLLLGTVGAPFSFVFFEKFIDAGWAFAKILSLGIITFLFFILSTLNILPFETWTFILLIAGFALINLFIAKKRKLEMARALKSNFGMIAFEEILFLFGLVTWSIVRGHQPDINGLEKFMDYGFINSILRSGFMPPTDMWYAGSSINYYWFGHLYTAWVTKVTSVPADISYNLMVATIFAFSLTSIFSLAASLAHLGDQKRTMTKVFVVGLLSAILVTLGGNFHTPFYAIKSGIDKYWYPDATRFIGYNPETEDKTIHEFPLYSFVVSDLHGHLLNLPFVILYIALLFSLFERSDFGLWKLTISNKQIMVLILLGLILGIMFMTSTWDFGNYAILTGAAFFIFNLAHLKKPLWTALVVSAVSAVMVVILGLIFASPFIASFKSIAEGVDFVNARTPLWQLLILWGFPITLSLTFLATLFRSWKSATKSDFFVLALLTTSWLLIILPEIIYVKDIYAASHHRANTMFKLTYQAFVMSYISSGYVAIKLIETCQKTWVRVVVIFSTAVIFGGILWYPNFAIKSYYGELKNYKGLSGETWLKTTHPETYDTIHWFRKNVVGQPTILEAPGDSYTEANVISSYTGLPTVVGWFVHEWLWRGSADLPQRRNQDVDVIYTSTDVNLTKRLLDSYDVRFIIVGPQENKKYPNINTEKIKSLGEAVYKRGSMTVYKTRFRLP